MRRLMISTALAGALFAVPAFAAVTISFGGTPVAGEGSVTSVAGTQTVNFNTAGPFPAPVPTAIAGIGSYGGSASVVTLPNVSNVYITPWNNTSAYFVAPIVIPGSPPTGPQSGIATFTAETGKVFDYFGLYWGSVDKFNFISFFQDSTLVFSATGRDLMLLAGGPQDVAYGDGTAASSRYVNFLFSGSTFNSIRFESTERAFESDNHAFRVARPVSEPMTAGLLGAGLLGLALMRRHRG
jgi:hypothetical protein